ncbi:unnamed protein product [Clonostachys byssicola]|uniref:Uncharacterized protein n=1 Tax=Clonostachys byssicola TaxID=160290 RepID=A0A9N9TYT1_9HYPO|nr:unnamed protein product [Clonostachys byssicola]
MPIPLPESTQFAIVLEAGAECPDRDGDEQQEGVGGTMRERMQRSNAVGFAGRPYRVGSRPGQSTTWMDMGWPLTSRSGVTEVAGLSDSCMLVGGWMVDGQKHRAGMGDGGGVDASRLVHAFASRRER